MKIYLAEKDNGESYEDYYTHISGAFTTYRGAVESLLKEGYKPYPSRNFNEWDIRYTLKTIEGQPTLEEIEEMRKEDEKNGHYEEEYDFGYEMEYGATIIEIELHGAIE